MLYILPHSPHEYVQKCDIKVLIKLIFFIAPYSQHGYFFLSYLKLN